MLPTRFPQRAHGLRAIAAFLALSFTLPDPALALRPEQKEGKAGLEELRRALANPAQTAIAVAPASVLTSAAGLEESKKPLHLGSGELDEIGQRVLPLIIRDQMLRREHARRIGWAKQQRRINEEKGQPAPRKEISPVLQIAPIRWDNFVENNAETLQQEGLLRISIGGGEAALLLRHEPGQSLMLDLLLRPDPGAFVWAGKIDLFMSASRLRYVAKGAAFGTRFSPAAESFLETNRIPDSGDSSPFTENRLENPRRALLVNKDSVERLGLSDEQIGNLILLSAVEMLAQIRPHYKDLGVDDTFDNENLISIEFLRDPKLLSSSLLIARFNKLKPALIRRLYLAHPAAGLEEADITVNGPDGPITWKISKSVKDDIDELGSENPSVEEGASKIRAALSGGYEKFQKYQNLSLYFKGKGKGLFFWALEHFSDPDLPLTRSERKILGKAIIKTVDNGLILYMGPLMSQSRALLVFEESKTERAFEAWRYLIVRFLAMEYRLEQISPTTKLIQTHIELVRALQTVMRSNFYNAYKGGSIHRDPKDFYERQLIELALSAPTLRPLLTELHDDSDLIGNSDLIARELFPPKPKFSLRSGRAIAQEVQKQQVVMRQIAALQNVVTPRSAETIEAWDHPISYLERVSRDANQVVFESRFLELKGTGLSNATLFQLDWIDSMARAGFKKWALAGVDFLRGIQEWDSQKNGDRRSIQDFFNLVQQYLDGHGTIPLRTFLALPQGDEPPSATAAIKFLEEIYKLKNTYGAEVKYFPRISLSDVNATDMPPAFHALMDWMRINRSSKSLVLNHEAVPMVASSGQLNPKNNEGLVVIRQIPAHTDFMRNRFFFERALGYVSHRIGMSRGWGDRKSASIPIRHNRPLAELFQDKELWSYTDLVVLKLLRSTVEDSPYDAIVVSADPDEKDEEEPSIPPETEDIGLRTGPRELVPVGLAPPVSGSPVGPARRGPQAIAMAGRSSLEEQVSGTSAALVKAEPPAAGLEEARRPAPPARPVPQGRAEIFAHLSGLMAQFRRQPELQFGPAAPSSVGTVVDLSSGLKEAVAALYLPEGSTVLVNPADLVKAEELTGRTAPERNLKVFYVREDRDFVREVNRAIGSLRGVDSVRVFSTRPEDRVEAAVEVGGRDLSVSVRGGLSPGELLANVGAVWDGALKSFLNEAEESADYARYL